MSTNSTIIDTYPSFLSAVKQAKPVSIAQWLSCWAENYRLHWSGLYELVVDDYADQGEDWRQIGRERIFPGMEEKLPVIDQTYRALRPIINTVEEEVRTFFDFRDPLRYVIYIGLGNGAGWVTKYEGRWAVLFGLEGIVDSGFHSPARLNALVAHELGHVVHYVWREAEGLNVGDGPWWQLYEEGFAQACELEVLAGGGWHMRSSMEDSDWLDWCQENRAWLAAEFLRTVDQGQSVRPFFGSWYDLRGRKQTGYFLGQQVISQLAARMALRDIALLDSRSALERTMRQVVSDFAAA